VGRPTEYAEVVLKFRPPSDIWWELTHSVGLGAVEPGWVFLFAPRLAITKVEPGSLMPRR
jgi:hypothetical protein